MDISKIKHKLKAIVEGLPYSIGQFFPLIPNRIIFGKEYKKHKKNIAVVEGSDNYEKRQFVFTRVKNIVEYAYQNIPFYKKHYDSLNFSPNELNKFEDIRRIPIIRKEHLQKYSLEQRSNTEEMGVKINTGGTTGEPLEFFIESSGFSREWAHMLHIWSELDYSRTDLKLTFRGKNIGDSALRYNPVNNEYLVNTYMDMGQVAEAIGSLIKKRKIRYIHGYPSAIYEFGKYIENHNYGIVNKLNKSLKGILYGSEYPAPVYRDLINRVFKVPDMSWYGHSEMCILAYETNEKFVYEPMLSYGYSEAVRDESGDDFKLIGTSYHNKSSPFIRYDTGDLVTPQKKDGILQSFKISKGRVGEFIKDGSGQNISLTSLIFGRHHEIFGKAKFIQIGQSKVGNATIYVTPFDGVDISEKEIKANFDSTNVNVEFSYQVIDQPYKSSSGKVPLLVSK